MTGTVRQVRMAWAAGWAVAALAACSGASDGAETVAAEDPAVDEEEVTGARFFAFDDIEQVVHVHADAGSQPLPCCGSAVTLLEDDGGETLRVETHVIEGSGVPPIGEDEHLLVSVDGEHTAHGSVRWTRHVAVTLTLSGATSAAEARSAIEEAASALTPVDGDPLRDGLTVDPSTGFHEVANRPGEASPVWGGGGSVEARLSDGRQVRYLTFRRAPISDRYVELNSMGSVSGTIEQIGDRRVLIHATSSQNPGSASFVEDGFVVTVSGPNDLDGLRSLVPRVQPVSRSEWQELRDAWAVRAKRFPPFAQLREDGAVATVHVTANDVPNICVTVGAHESCERAFTAIPTVGVVAVGSGTWVVATDDEDFSPLRIDGRLVEPRHDDGRYSVMQRLPGAADAVVLEYDHDELVVGRPLP